MTSDSNQGKGKLSSFHPMWTEFGHPFYFRKLKVKLFLELYLRESTYNSFCLHSWCKFSPSSFVPFYAFSQQCNLARSSQTQQVGSHVLLINSNLHPIVKLDSVLTNNVLNTARRTRSTALKVMEVFEENGDGLFL